jgi:plastocyanin
VRSPAARLIAVALAVVVVVLAATLLRQQPRPYVITAIDYHFHDAHPTLPIHPGRDLVVKNAGRNLHNVTIPALDIAADVAPGDELNVEDIAGRLEPGSYEILCRFHEDRGMTGLIVIAGA